VRLGIALADAPHESVASVEIPDERLREGLVELRWPMQADLDAAMRRHTRLFDLEEPPLRLAACTLRVAALAWSDSDKPQPFSRERSGLLLVLERADFERLHTCPWVRFVGDQRGPAARL
jgi:hypothetical protein